MSKKKQQKTPVNCWFCDENSYVPKESCNGWLCNKCQQYNGFTLDGDYNTDIPGQHDLKNGKTDPVCEPGVFHTASPVLCATCNNNQALYVRQLASFKSLNEESYDEELRSYKEYLEEVYKLCPTCESEVEQRVTDQDQLLQSKLSSAQNERLQAVSKRHCGDFEEDNNASGLRQLQFPSVPALLFQCCFLLTIVHAGICLRLFAVTVVSRTQTSAERNTLLSRWMLWVVSVVPAHFALSIQESVIHLGTVACLAGLFSCGKYSLYPEDCIHLLLRLLTLLMWMGWIPVAEGHALLLSIFTVLFALVACCRPRKPRYFSQLLFARKNINSLNPVIEATEVTEPGPAKSTVSEAHEISTSNSSISNSPPPPFEEVCQDLETFSIGLCKKSGSKSSIWSLPAIITSSLDPGTSPSKGDTCTGLSTPPDKHMSPDSTTGDQVPPLRPGTPRSVLSPSRLGFINFDSTPGSRSPSPWGPFMGSGSSSDPTTQENSMTECGSPSLSQQGSCSQNMIFRNWVTFNDRQQDIQATTEKTRLRVDQFLQRQMHQAQPTSEFPDLYLPKSPQPSRFGPRDCHDDPQLIPSQPCSRPQQFGIDNYHKEYLLQNDGKDPTYPSSHTTSVRRRSQRIAMAGKLPKPWPLRKSYSCNNATDKETIEKAGASARLEKLQTASSSSTTNRGFVQYNPLNQNMSAPWLKQSQLGALSNSTGITNEGFLQNRAGNHAEPAQVLQSSEMRFEEFLQYRDVSSANPSQTIKSNIRFGFNTEPAQRNWFTTTSTANVNNKPVQSEFSDAEDMDVDQPWEDSARKQHKASNSAGIKSSDMSLRWMLLGTVIGASVTCNIFLLLHGWIQQ